MTLFDRLGADVLVRPEQSLYLWAALPDVPDSLALAEKLLQEKVMIAPGRIFRVDADAPSPWSRYNVGALQDPRFEAALRTVLGWR